MKFFSSDNVADADEALLLATPSTAVTSKSNNKTSRRRNRTLAMQALYILDLFPERDFERFWRHFLYYQQLTEEDFLFAKELVRGTLEYQEAIDRKIRPYLKNWTMERVARVELAILRLAFYEMIYRSDIPYVVSINEAIELGKNFSAPESRRFINGILDQLKKDLPKEA